MDKKLQKEILHYINKKSTSLVQRYDIIDELFLIHFKVSPGKKYDDYKIFSSKILKQLNLLCDDNSIEEYEDSYYRLKKWGFLKTKDGIEKWWYWLIYRKHNLTVLIAILSLIVSIVALLFSFKK